MICFIFSFVSSWIWSWTTCSRWWRISNHSAAATVQVRRENLHPILCKYKYGEVTFYVKFIHSFICIYDTFIQTIPLFFPLKLNKLIAYFLCFLPSPCWQMNNLYLFSLSWVWTAMWLSSFHISTLKYPTEISAKTWSLHCGLIWMLTVEEDGPTSRPQAGLLYVRLTRKLPRRSLMCPFLLPGFLSPLGKMYPLKILGTW